MQKMLHYITYPKLYGFYFVVYSCIPCFYTVDDVVMGGAGMTTIVSSQPDVTRPPTLHDVSKVPHVTTSDSDVTFFVAMLARPV